MTLDEKVDQMCEPSIDMLLERTNPFVGLNPTKVAVDDLKKIVSDYGLKRV